MRLYDASGSRLIQTLAARAPTVYIDGQYQSWNQVLAGGENLVASYPTSAPNWSQQTSLAGAADLRFVVEVDVQVGGETRTLRIIDVTREPEIVT